MRDEAKSDDEIGERARSSSALTSVLALLVTAVVCALVAIAAPRPVEPSQLPALRLSQRLVAEQLARDRSLAARAPQGAPQGHDARALVVLIEREGRAELAGEGDFVRLAQERAELAEAAKLLFAKVGDEGTRAFVAALVERAMQALRAPTQTQASRALLGGFPRLLMRYGYANERGALQAPELSVRALFKARLNLITERPLVQQLSAIERQAYAGWNALHAGALEPEHRAQAARLFYESGGIDGAEALAIWLYQGGAREQAAVLLRREHERTGALRLRNMALFALRP